jgi:hypothetical protein
MARTFFLESAQPKKVAVASTKQSFKTVMEQTAILENAILESEVSYKDILIESMQGEASGLLMEADDAAKGSKIKDTIVKYFAKMVEFFKNLGKKVAEFLRNSLTKIKRFFINSAAWVTSKLKDVKDSNLTGNVKIVSKFESFPNARKVAAEFKTAFDNVLKDKQQMGGDSHIKDLAAITPSAKTKKEASEITVSVATAITNIKDGPKLFGAIEKNFKEAIKLTNAGLKGAKAGHSHLRWLSSSFSRWNR